MRAHSYSTDSPERRLTPFFIAALAILAAFFAFRLTGKYHIKPPWWWSPPVGTMALYGLFYSIFDRYIWKLPILYKLGLSRIPDLSGNWSGRVQPSETDGVSAGLGVGVEVNVSIKQTWTTILISGQAPQSKFHSMSGSIVTTDERTLTYEFLNEPSASAPATMHTHRGVARLKLSTDQSSLDGDYYSGRDRQNIGEILLTRE